MVDTIGTKNVFDFNQTVLEPTSGDGAFTVYILEERLKNVYKNNKFDYIHFNIMDFSCFERILYAHRYSNAKLIVHSHSSGFFRKSSFITKALHNIGKIRLKHINYLKVACGEQAGKFMFGINKFDVLYNGIDFKKFKELSI